MTTPDDTGVPEDIDHLAIYEAGLKLLDEASPGYDPVEGARLMRQAAEGRMAMAQVKCGVLCYYGTGVPKNHEEAFRWYAKSLETGGHLWGGGFNIGDLHDDSDEFPKNPIEAAAWFALSLEMSEGPGRLAALLPQFGPADVARVVARAMTIVEMLQDKRFDERLRPMRGLSLEPPDGRHPEDTPVTMLSVLIPLHAAMASKYSLGRLVHELRHGDSSLYGAFRHLNPEDHAKGQIPMVEPEFVGEVAGEPTALLYSSRFNFMFGQTSGEMTPVAMTSQKYLEVLLPMGVSKLRLDQSLFGEVTLDIAEVIAIGRKPGVGTEKAMAEEQLDGDLPAPPPFKVAFPHEGRTYVAEGFFSATTLPKSSESEPQIIHFGLGGMVKRVTCDGVDQDSPEKFEQAIVDHLNRSRGMRDGDFPEAMLLDEETFLNALSFHFRKLVRAVRNGERELGRSPDSPRFAFVVMENRREENSVFLQAEPRSRSQAGFVTAILKIREAQFERMRNVLENDPDFMSGLFERLKVSPEITGATWFESDSIDETTGKARRKYPDGRGDHPLLKFHMGNGLSAQDEEGAERLANIMARLYLLIQELDQHSLRSQNREN